MYLICLKFNIQNFVCVNDFGMDWSTNYTETDSYSHNKLWLRFCTSVCTWSSQPNQIAKNANQVFVLWSLEWTSWFYCWPDSWEESKRQVPCAVLRFVCVFVFYSIIFILFWFVRSFCFFSAHLFAVLHLYQFKCFFSFHHCETF